MVAPIALAAAGLSAAGKIFGGITANSAARARARALEDGARQALNEAGVAAQLAIEDDERAMARAVTLAAAGGRGATASRVLADLERQSVFRARTAAYRGQAEARNKRYDAQVSRAEGRSALIGSFIDAGSSLLSTFAQGAEAKRAAAAGGGR